MLLCEHSSAVEQASAWEYCHVHEDDDDFLVFHVEHIVAKQHGGTDDPGLLCYACEDCNLAKGPNLGGLFAGTIYPLFNPRKQNWKRHFRWESTKIVGKTIIGKVTVQFLI